MNRSFEKLMRRSGAYSLPYLIHLHDKAGSVSIRLVNDTRDAEFGGDVYKAGSFKYEPNAQSSGFDGGGTLEIATVEESVAELVERNREIELEVVGCMREDGEITELKSFRHHYGSVSGDRKTISFTFDADDRLSMTFPTLVWTTQNNKGNA